MESVWKACHTICPRPLPPREARPAAGGWQARAMGEAAITVVPANEASWDDLRAIFGARGQGAVCWCQRYKLAPGEAFRHEPAAERAERCGRRRGAGGPGPTSGLVAYRRGRAGRLVRGRAEDGLSGLLRVYRVPWAGRAEVKADASVWAVTCFFVRAGFRRQGVS